MKITRLVALLLLFVAPTVVQAQQTVSYTPDQKWDMIEAQMIKNLQAPIDDIRTQTLKNTIVLATLYRDRGNLHGLVSSLREVHETASSATHRKLAVAALQAIGNSGSSQYLARHATERESEEGRMTVASILNDYYLSHEEGDAWR